MVQKVRGTTSLGPPKLSKGLLEAVCVRDAQVRTQNFRA